MKNTLFLFSLLLAVFLFPSCEKLSLPNENTTEDLSEKQSVTIRTRSISEEIQYPLIVYAFDKDGKYAASQTLKSSSDVLSLSLSKGTYHIVAVSDVDGYTLPSNPDMTSVVSFSGANNCAPNPLQMGQADINVVSSQTVNLVLSYKVTPVNLSLSGIPSNTTAVSVSISQQYSGMNLSGEYSNGKPSKIELTKSSDKWIAESYVYPGASSQTVLSVEMTSDNGTVTYGYTYNSPFQVATPYTLNGTYESDAISLSGSFLYEGWSKPVSFDFCFGPNGDSGNIDTPSQPVSAFPTAGSVWEGHVVAYVYDDSYNILSPEDTKDLTSVNLLLVSLEEWKNVKSALNTTDPDAVMEIRDSYTENDLSGWTIPTESEVYNLSSFYSVTYDTLEDLDRCLMSLGANPVGALTDDDTNIRFLCDGAKKTFVWRKNPDIRQAGATVKYSLRLVNHVKVSK